MDWKLSLAGLLIGLLVGMTGMGGGSLMTPMLILVFGFKPTVAIGTDILHGAIFKSFGAAQHRQLGHVHARLDDVDAARFGCRCRSSAWRCPRASSRYGDGYESAAKQILGVALVVGGIGFFVKTFVEAHGTTSRSSSTRATV